MKKLFAALIALAMCLTAAAAAECPAIAVDDYPVVDGSTATLPLSYLLMQTACGVDEDTAREAVSSVDEEDQSAAALDLARKGVRKMKPGEDPRKARQRVLRSLVQRGFDWDVAKEACDRAFSAWD